MRILIAGGVQKSEAHQLAGQHRFAHARLCELEPGGEERVWADYESPAAHRPDEEPSIVFTAASVDAQRIWVPTKTEILVYRRSDRSLERVISLPAFNDLHHVRPDARGHLWVVNTGLDQILELDAKGELHAAHAVMGGDPWARFDRGVDYRKVTSTKPHVAHPNYLLRFEDRWWVTRFRQRDCVELGGTGRMPIDLQGCHDGVVEGEWVYFTTVDGQVVKTRPGLEAPAEVWDLNAMVGGLRKLGWCRGLHLFSAHEVLVGFSRLRVTKWRDNVAWAGGLETIKALRHRPTRLTRFDLRAGRVTWEHELERLDAVFSLHVEP